MRPALLAGLTLALAPVASAAPSGPYLATVVDPEVRLRAGPSDQFPETATLTKGTPVLVDHEEPNGWLAVSDPPGRIYSLSWVQGSFIDFDNTRPIPQQVVVEEPTKLAVGQIGSAQPLTHVRRTSVPAGTILTVIGPKVSFEGKYWHPVLPPPGDFRYLPKSAVRPERSVSTAFTVRDETPSAESTAPAAAPVMPTAPAEVRVANQEAESGRTPPPPTSDGSRPTIGHPLWAQAETAEREGRFDDAERLLFQLARLMNEPGGDHDIANLCYTRIHALREKRRLGPITAVNGTRSLPPPDAKPASTPTTTATPPVRTNGTPSDQPLRGEFRDDRPKWHGPGRLRYSVLAIDGRRTYALESSGGVPLLYVVPAQGVDLDRAVGRRVEVYGVASTRSGLSKPYVVATAVEVVP